MQYSLLLNNREPSEGEITEEEMAPFRAAFDAGEAGRPDAAAAAYAKAVSLTTDLALREFLRSRATRL
jgi:hypothetical protein